MIRNKLYYSFKPFIPRSLRLGIRSWITVRKREGVTGNWPILPGSETPPEGWPGWPAGKKFALVLTHDVEGQSGVDKSRRLMELEAGLGFRSSFNFIPEGDYRVSKELRDVLTSSGFEIGVHDLHHDGKLYSNRAGFVRKAARINQYLNDWGAIGFRSGFMLHNLDWIGDLNVLYDASTFDTDPFEPQPYGAGTIFPFWVPRAPFPVGSAGVPPANSVIPNSALRTPHSAAGYVELPYTLAQDSTVFLLLRERHPDIWFQKLDWIARHGGMALLNLHPDYIRFDDEPSSALTFPAELYSRFLQYVRQRYGDSFWQPLPKELAGWYRQQASVGTVFSPRGGTLRGKRAAVVLYGGFPSDARPRRELETLLDEGMSVDLFCLQESADEPLSETQDRLRVIRFPLSHKRSGKVRYFWQYAGFWLNCLGWLSTMGWRRRYHLVHIHNMPDILVFTAVVPRLLGAKVMLDLHDPMPELYQTIYGLGPDAAMVSWLKRLERWSIRFADLVLTPNQAFKDLFCSRTGEPAKVQIVMNSPDEKIFSLSAKPLAANGASHPKAEFRLMYHGLIAERHGLNTALHAVSHLSSAMPGLVLDMYGQRNDFADEVLCKAKALGLEEKVRYQGNRRLDDIPALIQQADLGIIPNLKTPFTEINFPTRIFEYLSLNKPVVVPDTKGIRDYFNDEQIFYFKPNDAGDLARVITWIREHPAETQKVLAAGRSVYEQKRWPTHRRDFLSLVASLLSC